MKIIVIVAFTVFLTGCGTLRIFDRDIPDFSDRVEIFPATKADFRGLTSGDIRGLLVIIDIPIAIVVDTLFLPWDLTDTEDKRFRRIYKDLIERNKEVGREPKSALDSAPTAEDGRQAHCK